MRPPYSNKIFSVALHRKSLPTPVIHDRLGVMMLMRYLMVIFIYYYTITIGLFHIEFLKNGV